MKKLTLSLFVTFLTTSLFADVIRHPLPNNSTFPISRAVEVSPDTTIIYHSGQHSSLSVSTLVMLLN